MFIKNKQDLRRVSYICLTLLSLGAQAEGNSINRDCEDDFSNISRTSRFIKKDIKDSINIKYNVIGVAIFNGESLVSNAIKKVTNSEASHVGLLVSSVENENEWFCLEATGSGVHLSSFTKEYINHYKGNIKYRLAIFEDRDRPDPEQVTQFVNKFIGKQYSKLIKLVKALFQKNRDTEYDDSSSMFCSELVAHGLKWLDILREEGASSNFLPSHFKYKGKLDKNSSFQVELTDEFSTMTLLTK